MTTLTIILLIIGWLACGFFVALHDAKTNNMEYNRGELTGSSLLGLLLLLFYLSEHSKFWSKKVFSILLIVGGLSLTSCNSASQEEHMTIVKVQMTRADIDRGKFFYFVESNGNDRWYFQSNKLYKTGSKVTIKIE